MTGIGKKTEEEREGATEEGLRVYAKEDTRGKPYFKKNASNREIQTGVNRHSAGFN